MKKLLLILLASLLCLSSCAGNFPGATGTDTADGAQTTGAAALTNDLADLLRSAEYRIVRADAASDAERDAAARIYTAMRGAVDYEMKIQTDWVKRDADPDAVYPYEILVGDTNRSASAAYREGIEMLDYVIAREGTRLVIAAGSAYALSHAADAVGELLAAESLSLPIKYSGSAAEGDKPVKLRIGSYNIKNGTDVGYDYSVIASDITNAGLDICGLQEIDQLTSRNGGRDTMKLLSEASGYAYYAFARAIDYKGGQYGTAILSKYPIVSFEVVPLVSDGHENRSYGHAVIDVNGTLIDFYNTHLSYESLETRTKQFAVLASALADKSRWVLTADFNTQDFNEFSVIKNSVLVNNESHKMLSFSGKSAIDNIVLPSAASVENFGCCNQYTHSDHFMIWAEVIMP